MRICPECKSKLEIMEIFKSLFHKDNCIIYEVNLRGKHEIKIR